MKARLVVRRGDQLLLEQRCDDNGNPFYRPIGGNVEFGETSRDAVVRELYEEMHMHVQDLTYLGCVEDILESGNGVHHEVCFLYEGSVREKELYERESITVLEDVRRYKAYWKCLSDFQGDEAEKLRPAQLLSLAAQDDSGRKEEDSGRKEEDP